MEDLTFFVRDVSLIINSLGIGVCLFLSAMFYFNKSGAAFQRNIYSSLFLIIGVIILNSIFNFMGYMSFTRHFELLSNVMTIFLPVLVHFSLNYKRFTEINKTHFFVPLLYSVLWILRDTRISGLELFWDFNELILVLFINIYFLVYVILDQKLLLKKHFGNFQIGSFLFAGIYVVWGVNLLILGIKFFVDDLHPLISLNVSILFSLISFKVIWHRIEKNGFLLVEKLSLGKKEISQIIHQIELQKYYQNPNLTIRVLADKIKVPYYELSKGLNEHANKNFNTLINEIRVKEVVRNIQDPNNKFSIWGLAQEAGFNSRTAFYNALKKHTGKSPSEMKA